MSNETVDYAKQYDALVTYDGDKETPVLNPQVQKIDELCRRFMGRGVEEVPQKIYGAVMLMKEISKEQKLIEESFSKEVEARFTLAAAVGNIDTRRRRQAYLLDAMALISPEAIAEFERIVNRK